MIYPMRTLLYVPGNRPKMIQKAPTCGADFLVLDLEDSVPPGEKATARAAVEEAIKTDALGGARVMVRINGLSTLESSLDLKAVVTPGLWGLRVPKVEGPGELRELDGVVRDLERHAGLEPSTIQFLPTIETPLAVERVYDIALMGNRIAAIAFGGEDLLIDLGVERSRGEIEFMYARGRMAMAAAAAGIPALDGVYPNFSDEEGLMEQTRLIKQLGFSGRSVIHPRQIAPVHRVFAPSPEEVAWARRVVEAADQAEAEGSGSVGVDGRMVDIPIVKRARRMLANQDSGLRAE